MLFSHLLRISGQSATTSVKDVGMSIVSPPVP